MHTHVKFTAEHIGERTAKSVIKEVEKAGHTVICAQMDPLFINHLILIVDCDEKATKQVRELLWKRNNGMCIEIEIITGDQLEEYL